jgi:acyl-CoA synthetase (AMP-forming)/AMP-acid ligase II
VNESFATLWEAVAAAVPDQVAIRDGAVTRTYAEFEERSARLASMLGAAGVGRGAKVACCMYNSAAYLETVFAALKLSAVPVNVNYRYQREELAYLLTDAGAEAIVYHRSLADRVEAVLPGLPGLRVPIVVDDELLVAGAEPMPPQPRSGDDQLLVYTGGTTGLPKGVVWIQSALFDATAYSAYRTAGRVPPSTLDEAVRIARELRSEGRRTISLPVVPLMHTTGLFVTMGTLLLGGTVVFAPGRSLDARAVFELVAAERVTQLVIAGNAVARPLVDELRAAEAAGRPHDLTSLERITSSGVAWSDDLKRALLERRPMQLVEILGASEGGPFAVSSVSSVSDLPSRFTAAVGTRVLRSDGTDVAAGSGEIGELAFVGAMPVGYHGDPERTARTYRWIGGVRHVVSGDFATVATDGSIELLGRGAAVINTGGEKVYTKEVEDVLLTHSGVADCVVVGVPDERWGEAVAAVVQLAGAELPAEALIDHVGAKLAGYKKPRHVVFVDAVRRGPNGKVELRWAREVARARQ